MIRSTARQQWRLLAVNLGSSVLEALSEGATLAVVFLAVLPPPLQSLSRFANNVSVGYFAAECRARVTARIHSQGPAGGDPHPDPAERPAAGSGAGWRGFERLGRTWIGFPLSRQAPQPEQPPQPPPANGAPHAARHSRAAAPTNP